MTTLGKLGARLRRLLPGYLRNDNVPTKEQKEKQKVASSTTHG